MSAGSSASRSASGPGRDPGELLAWGILLVALLFVAAVRIRLLTVPFERDEGEYAYAGQLILQGVPPYRLVYNMKLPGTYAAYALIMALFGQTVQGVHLGLLLINTATTWLLCLLARRLFGSYAGAGAGASYALLSLSPSVLGPFAHATHFVLLPALAGLLLLLRGIDSGRPAAFLGSGLLLGLGFVMKQHGLFFVLFALFYLAWGWAEIWDRRAGDAAEVAGPAGDAARASGAGGRPAGWRRVLIEGGLFGLGAALPFALTCLVLAACGVFRSFWFWTFEYARTYASEVPIAVLPHDLPIVLTEVAGPVIPIWILAAAGLVALCRDRGFEGRRLFVAGLLIFSFLAVLPGYYLRPHYFILFLPAVALLAGLAIDWLRRLLLATRLQDWAASLAAMLLLVACLITVYPQAPYFLGMTPLQVSRVTYETNPFPEAVEIGAYLEAHSDPGDRIAVFGSEPEIFFYAKRRSATGHVYMYGLMEEQAYARTMQQEAIREIEASDPRFLVFVNVFHSWIMHDHSERLILDWYQKYADERYDCVGLVEILSDDETTYTWGPEASARPPRTPYHLYIYQRKSTAPRSARVSLLTPGRGGG